jgi:hypothetical protein
MYIDCLPGMVYFVKVKPACLFKSSSLIRNFERSHLLTDKAKPVNIRCQTRPIKYLSIPTKTAHKKIETWGPVLQKKLFSPFFVCDVKKPGAEKNWPSDETIHIDICVIM